MNQSSIFGYECPFIPGFFCYKDCPFVTTLPLKPDQSIKPNTKPDQTNQFSKTMKRQASNSGNIWKLYIWQGTLHWNKKGSHKIPQ